MNCAGCPKVDAIYTNATIYTVDEGFGIAEAMAIRGGRVVALGSAAALRGRFSAEELVDCRGAWMYPGFMDPHSHLLHYALALRKADLRGCVSWEEVGERLRRFQEESPTEWVEGRGWDQTEWRVKKIPDKRLLDSLFPDKPALVTRIDGHAAVANTRALEAARLDESTEICGGKLMKRDGKLTGLLVDNAIKPVRRVIPKPETRAVDAVLLRAQRNCFAVGLTSVSDAGLERDEVLAMEALQGAGAMKLRIYAMLLPTQENYETFVARGVVATERLTVRSLKLFADGALGSRGARLLEPYEDDPGNIGIDVDCPEAIEAVCAKAYAAGYQVNTHCIGDAAVRRTLDVYAKFLRPGNDRRWRIEHAQIIHPDDLPRFGEYRVVPSVQTSHAISDMRWVRSRLGERVRHAYVYRDLLEQNGWLANGSDFPIEGVNPMIGFYTAVSRKDLSGRPEGGFQPENALGREEALRAMTIWAAKANFEEGDRGSLEPGKLADFVLLDRDILRVPEDRLPGTTVAATYVGGEKVYEA